MNVIRLNNFQFFNLVNFVNMAGELLNWLANPIGSTISAIGGAISNYQQSKENQKNREWSEMMWNKTNAYNDPSAQRARLEAAGYNPNLAISNGLTGLAQYGGNLGTNNNYENPLRGFNLGFIEARQLKNETERTQSDIKTNQSVQAKNEADTNKSNKEAEYIESQKKAQDIENKYLEANKIVDLSIKGENKTALDLANKFARESNPLQVQELQERINNLVKDGLIKENTANLINEQIELTKEQEKTEKSKQASNYADVNYKNQLAISEEDRRVLMRAQAGEAVAAAEMHRATARMQDALGVLHVAQRFKIAQEMYNNRYDLQIKLVKLGLSKAEAFAEVTRALQAVRSGDLEWLEKTQTKRYGTGPLGTVLNFMYDSMSNITGL